MGFPFSDYIALLEHFLDSRQVIVDGLERRLFGTRGRGAAQTGDRESIAEAIEACFFESPAISRALSGLKGKLEAAHLADGYEPGAQDGYSRGLDLVELVLRACDYWDRTRWPGVNGRLVYAQSLYAVFVLSQLERLSLRIWAPSTTLGAGAGDDQATERLQQIQRLLDLLNAGGGSGPKLQLVRDARWLIQTAQGPLTRHVRPYFIKAGLVASLIRSDRLVIHAAGAVLAGGHLRSQLRHLSLRTNWAFDDPRLVALTRSSNSMDVALLIRDLVSLLEAYDEACTRDDDARLDLADAILQGLSADPELLLTRLDLLDPSTLIEDAFVEEHREYLVRYGELLARTASSLQHDSRAFDPAQAAYSPLGIVYGFCADVCSNMVLNTLRSPSGSQLSLEDMFISRERLDEKQIQATGWSRLPKRDGERDPFEHSNEWARLMHARLTAALEARAARPAEPNASGIRQAFIYVVPRGVAIESLPPSSLPDEIVHAQEHCLTSDIARARATRATALPADRLVADHAEGRLLACVQSEGAWFAVSKIPLTLCIGQGKDALITDVPSGVIDVLRRVCPELVVVL